MNSIAGKKAEGPGAQQREDDGRPVLIRPVEEADGHGNFGGPGYQLLELAGFDIELRGAATVEIQ